MRVNRLPPVKDRAMPGMLDPVSALSGKPGLRAQTIATAAALVGRGWRQVTKLTLWRTHARLLCQD
jgi:hypothetical protein